MTDFTATLVDQALAAHARGICLPTPRLPNMERRHSVRYISELSRRLPAEEMTLLAMATEQREQALVKARVGDLTAARAQLRAVTCFVDEHISSPEGRLSARSLHAAASAFVEHAEGNDGVAHDLMLEALSLCRRQRLDYGHSVEVRRVHLGRNVARVVWSLGRHPEAWALCMDLLNYVSGSGVLWPLGKATDLNAADREVLRSDERTFLTDQLLSEAISTAADARNRSVSFDATFRISAMQGNGNITSPQRIESVLHLCRTALTAEPAPVIEALASYFEEGPGELPMTWRRAERFFQELTAVPLPRPVVP